jgi:hypothetical protein
MGMSETLLHKNNDDANGKLFMGKNETLVN